MNQNKTLDYYNMNADTFVAGTVSVDFEETKNRFLEMLESGEFILDFGCGSGRDTKYFLERGYRADVVDDGVKKNYAKFQNIEVVAQNGKKQKVNLLAKI